MAVSVQATGSLRIHIPSGTTLQDVETVGEAIERLDLPSSTGLAVLVNGHIAHWETTLHDGDSLQLVPGSPAGGQLLNPREA